MGTLPESVATPSRTFTRAPASSGWPASAFEARTPAGSVAGSRSEAGAGVAATGEAWTGSVTIGGSAGVGNGGGVSESRDGADVMGVGAGLFGPGVLTSRKLKT